MKTLIVVDAQYDFMPGGALEVPAGDQIIQVINEIQGHFDLVLATQDWHPVGHISFASEHDGKKPFETIELDGQEQILWPDHCIQGSKGGELHSEWDKRPIEAIFRKGMDPEIDSYSGFYDNAHKKSTGLSGYLREKKVTDLHIVGLAADVCVYYTIKDALDEGFDVTVIEDGTRALDKDDYAQKKKDLEQKGVYFTTSTSLSLFDPC